MLKRDEFKSTFEALKPVVLERDGNQCVKCRSTLSLEVHHIDGYKRNTEELLCTLCYLCHGVAPMGKEAFDEWLSVGESGIQTLDRYLTARGLAGLGQAQIVAFCSALIDLGFDLNVTRFRVARERIRKSGLRCEGRKPFGELEGEMAAHAQMLELRAQGMSVRAIAQSLNANHIPTRSGKPWGPATVAKIVKRRG